jgi:hypothetical protein
VLHCHILSHEEMDMMHAQIVGVAPSKPEDVTWTRVGNGANRRYDISWTDTSKNDTAFVVERRVEDSTDDWTTVATIPSAQFGVVPFVETGVGPEIDVTRSYSDPIGNTSTLFEYRVVALNTVGDVWDYSDPAFNEIPPGGGFPTLTLDSLGGATTTIVAPSDLTASAVAKNKKTATVTLNWTDNASNESGFLIQRATNAGFSLNVVNATVGADTQTFSQSVSPGTTYHYRVLAFNEAHQSAWSNTASVTTP